MAKGKLKMLYLVRILSRETDDNHGLTLQEIIERLEAVNIRADRKTLYADFEELRQFGFDIKSEQRDRRTRYRLGAREFELPELKLLIDSVQASKFITTRKSRELIRKLEGQASRYQAEQLQRQVYIAGRVKTMNESIYYNVDRIYDALNANRQIRFQYAQWSASKELVLRKGGAWYCVSPWAMVWYNDNYYLVAYDAAMAMIRHYRVDKMLRIALTGEARLGREHFESFDMASYVRSALGMFAGDETEVTLEADNALVGVVIDKFGKDISIVPIDEGRFRATFRVIVSPQFLGWVVGLGRDARVVAPAALVDTMRDTLRELLALYP